MNLSMPFLCVALSFGNPSSDSLKAQAAFNDVCPVMGEKVNAKARTVSYDGKTYGFCCNGCDKKFKANPAKYSANVSADGKKFVGKQEGH
jgi:YHS domain-containing protein